MEEEFESIEDNTEKKIDGDRDENRDDNAVESSVSARKAKKKGKVLIAVFIGVLVAVGAFVYCAMAMYYKERFFPGTVINGIDYSNVDQTEVAFRVMMQTKEYHLDVLGRDPASGQSCVLTTIPAQNVDLYISVGEADVAALLKQQNSWKWPDFLWSNGYVYTLDGDRSIDEAKLNSFLDEQAAFRKENMKDPQNAYIQGYSKEEKKFVIAPDTAGTKLDTDAARAAVREAMLNGDASVDLDALACYAVAAVREDNDRLQKCIAKANQCLAAKITYDWHGHEVILDEEKIRDWVSIENEKVLLDEQAVRDFVDENAKEYDTYGKNRKFKTTLGYELTLPSGAYGWRTDREAEAEELIALIKDGAVQEKEPVCINEAAAKGENDIGSTYVEADLSNQHLYLYQDGELKLESDFVSGNMSNGNMTPPGVFGLTYKTTNAVLRGPGYETPVTYWMPFNGNVGMHDATWRRAFGGDIYLTSGSHGCINLPLNKAEEIYQYVSKGFPVICYYYSQDIIDEINNPQDPAQEEPQNPAPEEPQSPAPAEPQNPAPEEPQSPAPAEPQNPAPEEPQSPAPAEPQNPAPEEPQSPAPAEPQNPAPEEPQSPAPAETPDPAPEEPQNPAPTETPDPAPAENTDPE